MSSTENIYLPKVVQLDRVVDEIHEVRTFVWHFEDPADQAAFKKFRRASSPRFPSSARADSGLAAPPSPRPRTRCSSPSGRSGAARLRCIACSPATTLRGAGSVRQRLPDGRLCGKRSGVCGRRDWADSARSYRLRWRIAALRAHSDLLRRQDAARVDVPPRLPGSNLNYTPAKISKQPISHYFILFIFTEIFQPFYILLYFLFT